MDARHVLIFTGAFASVAACFSDLPGATKCPADPQLVVGNCVPVLAGSTPMAGVPLSKIVHECLLGPRADCSCGASECPDATSSCYPALECPEAVRKAIPGASCPKPVSADVSQLACGCARCLSVCDGYGPSFGVVLPYGANAMPILSIPLAGLLPTSGKLGFYVRLRGLPTILAGFAFGPSTTKVEDSIVFTDFQASGTSFHEVLIGVTGPVRASWSTPGQAPTSIVLAGAPGSPGVADPGITYAQIDCVIPVLLP